MERSDRLSRACSAIARSVRELDEALGDPLGLGSDCGPLISRGARRALEVELLALGYESADSVLDEAALRTSDRWVYVSGLGAAS